MKYIILFSVFLLFSGRVYAQGTADNQTVDVQEESETNSNKAVKTTPPKPEGPQIPIKFPANSNSQEAIALVISNRTPVASVIRDFLNSLNNKGYKIAAAKQDVDISNITTATSPFAREVRYVMKFYVLNAAPTEQLVKINIEILRIADGKRIKQEIAFSRSNIPSLVSSVEKMLVQIVQQKEKINPMITAVSNNQIVFPTKGFPKVKKGDEVVIRYPRARRGKTESYAMVTGVTTRSITAKDLDKMAQPGDFVLSNPPLRNRFSFSAGIMVPTLGESELSASLDANVWSAPKRWPAGPKIEAEYERLLPYQLVSTTVLGINIDGGMGTYVMTGVGYRIIHNGWEFIPYFRIGAMYVPLVLQIASGSAGSLQGMTIRFGINPGMSFLKRIGTIYVGADIGLQWYPLSLVSVLTDSQKITPSWRNSQGDFTSTFSMTQLYPYISLKVGWLF
ncbi:MAG: hypothetical protein ACRCTQ_02215 [Brevinemataceae bacterium]